MHNLIHFYYQNKKKIWKVIIIIALIIALIQILNYIVGRNGTSNNKNNNKVSSSKILEDVNGKEPTNTIVSSEKSLVDGNELSSTSLKTAKQAINDFINCCNNGEVDKAYNLLTEECKEELYPTIEFFKTNYIDGIFKEPKVCIIENWTNRTYKVTITEDMLTTGNNINGTESIDYITIAGDKDNYKLNVNSYIGRTKINKTTEKKDLEVKVVSKDTYMDYEKYNIEINNKSEKNVILDNLEKNNTIYLEDSNKVRYNVQIYKLQKNDMIINSGIKREVEIAFSNGYTTSRKMENLVFSKLIFNDKSNVESNGQETYEFYIDL